MHALLSYAKLVLTVLGSLVTTAELVAAEPAASASAATAARRVDPKATRVAVLSESSAGARSKNSASLGLAPGHPPSMKVTPR